LAGKGNTVSRVTEIITPYAEELGLDIWDVRFAKEGTDWYLRIFIDKEGGISIDDCVDLTHAVTKPLDEADPISQSYTLEVSSPGVERELTADKHFEKYIGADVMVRLIRPVNNVRDYEGKLVSYNGGEITLSLADGEELKVNKKDTSYVKLDDFDIKDFEKEMN
jgi:ribosome maturation factor RimP